MRQPFWERVRLAMCRRFGHREVSDEYVVWCTRCRVLLRSARTTAPTPGGDDE